MDPIPIEKEIANVDAEAEERQERDEQEEIYQLLHRELVSLDRRVTRATARAHGTHVDVPKAISSGRRLHLVQSLRLELHRDRSFTTEL